MAHSLDRGSTAPAEAQRAPLVSVVVNNYNYEQFLGEAIDSSLAQTYAPVEVIVVDDGSTDRSRDVIAGYGDRITAVLKENGGQASAFNAGFARSGGDAVIFLDADDLLTPTAAAAAVSKFAPGVSAVHWPLVEIDEEGRQLGVYPSEPVAEGDLSQAMIAKGPWWRSTGTGSSGTAWSRALLARIMPVPPEFRDFADAYPMVLAPLAGALGAIQQPQAYYRYHGRNRYGGPKTLDARLALEREIYNQACITFSAELTRREIVHDPENWWRPGTPGYRLRWLPDGQRAIRRLVAPGQRFIVLDEHEWRSHWCQGGMVEGRYPLPFLERDGEYWGLPSDEGHAIRELERMRREGARLLFAGSSAFWWFDYYPAFSVHLTTTYRLAHLTEHLIAFDLTSGPEGQPHQCHEARR